MLRSSFNFAQDITIFPVEEITLGNRKLIKDLYEVLQDFGDHTKTIDRVQVRHGASRALVRETTAASMVGACNE